jgi:hypothetical protein
VFIFENFSFALFTPPPLGDYQEARRAGGCLRTRVVGTSTTASAREGGGYSVVGEADKQAPLPIDRGRDRQVRARAYG